MRKLSDILSTICLLPIIFVTFIPNFIWFSISKESVATMNYGIIKFLGNFSYWKEYFSIRGYSFTSVFVVLIDILLVLILIATLAYIVLFVISLLDFNFKLSKPLKKWISLGLIIASGLVIVLTTINSFVLSIPIELIDGTEILIGTGVYLSLFTLIGSIFAFIINTKKVSNE